MPGLTLQILIISKHRVVHQHLLTLGPRTPEVELLQTKEDAAELLHVATTQLLRVFLEYKHQHDLLRQIDETKFNAAALSFARSGHCLREMSDKDNLVAFHDLKISLLWLNFIYRV